MMGTPVLLALAALATAAQAPPPYPGWKHSGSVYLLTTPEGANLPQCPEVAGSTKGRLPTAPAIPLNAKPPAKPIAPAGSAGAPPK